MNRRWICSDVWMDILPSFDRPQLGLKIALLSDRFDVLVDAHFDGESELTLWNEIRICKDTEGPKPRLSVRIGRKSVDFPLPDRPLPNKIRFMDLQIEYIDHFVIEFLRANKQIWDSKGISLQMPAWEIETDDEPFWDVLAREIWPIFAPSIYSLFFLDDEHFDPLCRRISPTFLTDLDQLISIDFGYLFLHGIADDDEPNATSSTSQVLFKWLHTPRKDGKLKDLFWPETELDKEGSLDWINSFKETFIRATASASYQIFFGVDDTTTTTPIEPFELVNEGTKEKLTLKEETNSLWPLWLLKRCPIIIGETAASDQWEEDEIWGDNLNKVTFSLCDCATDNYIGPLSPPAEEEEEADESNGN